MSTPKNITRSRRHARIRSILSGTATRPRLAVHKSNTSISAQLIDDVAGTSLAGVNSRTVAASKSGEEQARQVGTVIAEKAQEKGVTEVVFDRGGFAYIGKIKILADAAREAGLKF